MTTTEFFDYLARYDCTRDLGETLTVIVERRREVDALVGAAATRSARTPNAA